MQPGKYSAGQELGFFRAGGAQLPKALQQSVPQLLVCKMGIMTLTSLGKFSCAPRAIYSYGLSPLQAQAAAVPCVVWHSPAQQGRKGAAPRHGASDTLPQGGWLPWRNLADVLH